VSIDGIEVPVISRADLIRNKQATGRPKDAADLTLLRELESQQPSTSNSIATVRCRLTLALNPEIAVPER
jgi:hypothetical protein